METIVVFVGVLILYHLGLVIAITVMLKGHSIYPRKDGGISQNFLNLRVIAKDHHHRENILRHAWPVAQLLGRYALIVINPIGLTGTEINIFV
jgi:hypothetical protein